ncbi:MAG: hypothetical protein ACFFCM_15425 [Promethearchaeota archaeon]
MEGNPPKVNVKDIQYFLEQAYKKGRIKCPKCFIFLEPDADECSCGWTNPLRCFGLI